MYIAVPTSPAWTSETSRTQPTTTVSPSAEMASSTAVVAVKTQYDGARKAHRIAAAASNPYNAFRIG